jgi:hypothetical protein
MPTRNCNRCHQSLEATPDNFLRDKSRPLGLAYECKPCHRARRKGRDRRKERYKNLTPEQRVIYRERQNRYGKSDKGRAIHLRKAYQRIDACDFSTDELTSLIRQPCTYCGTVDAPRGLDRISNDGAHVKGNVVPCCAPCNFARGDRLTMDEMMLVGAVIREIMEARHRG